MSASGPIAKMPTARTLRLLSGHCGSPYRGALSAAGDANDPKRKIGGVVRRPAINEHRI